jgi:Tol biopolymer transport system component
VTDIQEIPGATGPLVLSPDGSRLFTQAPHDFSRICILFIDSGEERCDSTGYDNVNTIDPFSIAWAPDSSAVAFGLNVSMLGIDPDILVIDAATGVIANLTDDGQTRLLDGLPYDVAPSWSRDGAYLAFQRTTIGKVGSALMRISRTGGDPTTLAALPADVTVTVIGQLRELPDGSWLFSQQAFSDTATPGVSRLGADGSITTVIDGDPGGDYPNPILASVAADGEWAAFVTTTGPENSANAGKLAFIDLESNAVIPIEVAEAPRVLPTFSPDGRELLFVTEGRDGPATAWLVPAGEPMPDELAQITAPAENIPGLAAMPLDPSVTWSRANLILIHIFTNTVFIKVIQAT